ncbi:MAG: GNAT family N-acetyltransferase [Neisseriales bacterium]|nr:MAG: GNAT family N-acetyltransferase [Neisseriales bacterium]
MTPKINFKLLDLADCTLLHTWLQQEHIREFWDDGDRTIQEVINHYMPLPDNCKRFIFSIDSLAVGYIQSYIIAEDDIGIDFFIGNLNFLGKGYAAIILKKFIDAYCSNKTVIVDPAIDNQRAIHIYQKLGFCKLSEFEQNGVIYQFMSRRI